MKYFLHTGFDVELGCFNFKRWMLPASSQDLVTLAQQSVAESSPLYMRVSKKGDGLDFGEWQTHGDVLAKKSWGDFANNLIDGKYFEL